MRIISHNLHEYCNFVEVGQKVIPLSDTARLRKSILINNDIMQLTKKVMTFLQNYTYQKFVG